MHDSGIEKTFKKDSASRLAKQTVIGVFTKLVTFISLYLYTFFVEKTDIANIGVLQATVIVLFALVSMQIHMAIFRYSIESKYLSTSKYVSSFSSKILLISLVIIFPAYFLDLGIFILALSLSFAQLAAYLKLELLRSSDSEGNYYKLLLFQVAISVFLTLLIISLFDELDPLYIYAVNELISWIVVHALAQKITNNYLKETEALKDSPKIKKFFQYGLFILPSSLAWWAITQSPLILIRNLFTVEEAAVYVISNRLPSVIALISFILLTSLGKNISFKFEENPRVFKRTYLKYFFFWFLGFLFFSICTLGINIMLLSSFYPDYNTSLTIQILQVLNAFLISNFSFIGFAYMASKNVKFSSVSSIIVGLVGILTGYYLGQFYGVFGILFGMTIGLFVGLIIRMIHIMNLNFEKK